MIVVREKLLIFNSAKINNYDINSFNSDNTDNDYLIVKTLRMSMIIIVIMVFPNYDSDNTLSIRGCNFEI